MNIYKARGNNLVVGKKTLYLYKMEEMHTKMAQGGQVVYALVYIQLITVSLAINPEVFYSFCKS